MRLKNVDGPLSVYNGNSNLLNSPKRINTIQNSNVTVSYNNTSNLNSNIHNSNGLIAINTTTANTTNTINATNTTDENLLNNINNTEDTVQWCNPARTHNLRQITNNVNNRNHQLFNINNTLAVSLNNTRHGTASSICSESSPDDSLLDYEDAHQSCSSVDTSPQEEDRGFDISDSESISDEVNLTNIGTLQPRGIVNPNYPGFQHLAHTLDYSLKASSDTDFTDDDFDCESSGTKYLTETNTNNINNNNNNNEETEYPIDKIDSVNRLDSVENIQKVFYDKPVFNIPLECENLERINCDSEEASTSNSNQASDDDLEIIANDKLDLNIPQEEKVFNCHNAKEPYTDIIGDFEKEVEQEFGRISRENNYSDLSDDSKGLNTKNPDSLIDKAFCAIFEPACALELEEAIEKLSVSDDLEPTATKYNIEPNDEQPFNKCSISTLQSTVLEDSKTITQTDMSALSIIHPPANDLKRHFPADPTYNENLKTKPDNLLQQKLKDAFLSNVQENIPLVDHKLFVNTNLKKQEPDRMDVEEHLKTEVFGKDSNRETEDVLMSEPLKIAKSNENEPARKEELEKFCKEDKTKDEPEKDEDSAIPRKKEKMETNYVKKRRDYNQQIGSLITIPRRELAGRNKENLNRRSVPAMKEKKRVNPELLGSFDVYNIETAMPKIDLEAIESHLRAAREEERRRRTDREEIRRRLAMGSEDDYYNDRPGRKPSLQARLQSGMNLQICFMNETVSDNESPSSDSECTMTKPKQSKNLSKTTTSHMSHMEKSVAPARPATLSIGQPLLQPVTQPMTETDFFARQARLQTEARMALAQAKEMARMQMEIERQKQKKSPITEMVRHSLEKVGIPFPEDRRRLSRQILTEMNVAQLQVIVNDLHTQIETLNENLVKFLMDRDDLHMEQDSMLVDIEDLTRYLGAKEQSLKEQNQPSQNNNLPPPSPAPSSPLAALNSTVKPHLHRIASLVKK